jgi:hypothetical protein
MHTLSYSGWGFVSKSWALWQPRYPEPPPPQRTVPTPPRLGSPSPKAVREQKWWLKRLNKANDVTCEVSVICYLLSGIHLTCSTLRIPTSTRKPFCRFQLSATWGTVFRRCFAISLSTLRSGSMTGRYSRKSRARGPLGKLHIDIEGVGKCIEYEVEWRVHECMCA